MTRKLIPGLVAEGPTDEAFLSRVIYRQLEELTAMGRCVTDTERPIFGSWRSVKDLDRVVEAARELAGECHVIFVHNDHNERAKAEKVRAGLAEAGTVCPVVPLVPVRETECWLLADRQAWAAIPGTRLDALPKRPRDVENLADPKTTMRAVLPDRRTDLSYYYDFIGRKVDLSVLAQVPAYARWLTATKKALEGLGYL